MKPGVGQQRCLPVCSVQTLSPGAASAGTLPFPVIHCPDAVEKAVASLLHLGALLRKTEAMPMQPTIERAPGGRLIGAGGASAVVLGDGPAMGAETVSLI